MGDGGLFEQTPADLVVAALSGDEKAWIEIVRRYERLIWSCVRSFSLSDADGADVAQTVWLKLAQSLSTIREPDRIGLWLLSTARNECNKVLTFRTRNVSVDAPRSFGDLLSSDEQPDRNVETQDRNRELWAAFRKLPETCRTLLTMLIADPPVPYHDISVVSGIAIGSIGSRRKRCLDALRNSISRIV